MGQCDQYDQKERLIADAKKPHVYRNMGLFADSIYQRQRFWLWRAENRGFREPERSVLKVREHRKRRKMRFAGRQSLNLSRKHA